MSLELSKIITIKYIIDILVVYITLLRILVTKYIHLKVNTHFYINTFDLLEIIN